MKRLHFRSLGKMDMFTLLNCQFHSRNILKSDFLSDFQTLCVWSLLQSAQTPKSCCAPPLAVFREKKCQKYCNILIEDTVLLHCTKIFFSLRRAAYTAVVSYYILVLQLYHFLCCIDKCKRLKAIKKDENAISIVVVSSSFHHSFGSRAALGFLF